MLSFRLRHRGAIRAIAVFLHLGSRRVWITSSTIQPDSAWVSLHARNFSDGRGRYGFRTGIRNAGQQREVQGSIRRCVQNQRCRDRADPPAISEPSGSCGKIHPDAKVRLSDQIFRSQLMHRVHMCRVWSRHYYEERPHLSRDRLPLEFKAPPDEAFVVRVNAIVCTSKLGGAINSYSRRAAQNRQFSLHFGNASE